MRLLIGVVLGLSAGLTLGVTFAYRYYQTLKLRFPDKELVVRNFARPADEVSVRQRPNDYTRLGDPMFAFNPDTILCFFGFNESFAGPAGVEKFKADYEHFLDEFAAKYPRDETGAKPRFVLVSPIAFKPTKPAKLRALVEHLSQYR